MHTFFFSLNHQIQLLDFCFILQSLPFSLLFSPSFSFTHPAMDMLKVKVPNDLQLSLSLPPSLCFSSFCCLLKIDPPPPNHQRSAAAGPVGTGFGKGVPEMSLINSLRRRERGREVVEREGDREGRRAGGW